jgi:hypothetical protein
MKRFSSIKDRNVVVEWLTLLLRIPEVCVFGFQGLLHSKFIHDETSTVPLKSPVGRYYTARGPEYVGQALKSK